MKVKLTLVAGELEMQFDEMDIFYDRETGEFLQVSEGAYTAAEEGSEAGSRDDFEQDELELAKRVNSGDSRFVALPSQFDVHEWDIMRRFCREIEDQRTAGELEKAISGRGAFRMFRSVIDRHSLTDAWYAFRTKALGEIARDWLEENEIQFEDDVTAK